MGWNKSPVRRAWLGIFLAREKANNVVMLRRALMVSILFHCALMLGWQPVKVSPWPDVGALGRLRILVAHLEKRGPIVQMGAPLASERQKDTPPTTHVASPELLQNRLAEGRLPKPKMPENKRKNGAEIFSGLAPLDLSAHNGGGESLREYRLDLAREARRYRQNPIVAHEHFQEGVVMIEVSHRGGMELPQVALLRTSGDDDLDADALKLVFLAVRSTSLPESLSGQIFALRLPVFYSLRD